MRFCFLRKLLSTGDAGSRIFYARLGTACTILIFSLVSGSLALADNEVDHADWIYEAKETIEHFEREKPELSAFFEKAHAYAVYPTVSKAALALGLAGGKGTVFENGEVVGFSRVTQVTFGYQAGIHTFREVIFFKNREVFEEFIDGTLELDVEVTAVAGSASASAVNDFDRDVLIYTMTKAGLMFDASIGGQRFSFEPK